MDFEIIKEIKVLVPERLDVKNASEFGMKVDVATDDINVLTLDFVNTQYVSSMGLVVILELYKKMQEKGKIKLINISNDVKKTFEIAGFSEFLDME